MMHAVPRKKSEEVSVEDNEFGNTDENIVHAASTSNLLFDLRKQSQDYKRKDFECSQDS